MLTCIIRYHSNPNEKAQWEDYARHWGQAMFFPQVAPLGASNGGGA